MSEIEPNKGILSIKKYVPGKSVDEVLRELNVRDAVKMASNENPFGISPKAEQAVRESIKKAFQYPEVSCPALLDKLSESLDVDKKNLILCNGADSVIYNIAMCLLNRNEEVIIPEITFPMYEVIANVLNVKTVKSGMKSYEIDINDILSKITDKTKIIWLCNPNNPTGSLIDNDTFTEFIKEVPENIMIVHDEVYYDFADRRLFPDTVKLIKEGKKNLFIIRSFSKVYGLAGIRLGYGIGSAETIEFMYRVRIPFDVSVLAQAAGIGALSDTGFYKKSVEHNTSEKEFIYSELDKINIGYLKSDTNFILINMEKDASGYVERLLMKGIIVRPMKNYGLPEFFRLTIGLREQNQKFIKILKEIL